MHFDIFLSVISSQINVTLVTPYFSIFPFLQPQSTILFLSHLICSHSNVAQIIWLWGLELSTASPFRQTSMKVKIESLFSANIFPLHSIHYGNCNWAEMIRRKEKKESTICLDCWPNITLHDQGKIKFIIAEYILDGLSFALSFNKNWSALIQWRKSKMQKSLRKTTIFIKRVKTKKMKEKWKRNRSQKKKGWKVKKHA